MIPMLLQAKQLNTYNFTIQQQKFTKFSEKDENL
jgi:hypothetical protein